MSTLARTSCLCRYFDLCQPDTARDGWVDPSQGRHATQRNSLRATLWSLCHMVLIGCILWISVSAHHVISDEVISDEK
jgi:hypothetical protein